jgi:hypothetical protein
MPYIDERRGGARNTVVKGATRESEEWMERKLGEARSVCPGSDLYRFSSFLCHQSKKKSERSGSKIKASASTSQRQQWKCMLLRTLSTINTPNLLSSSESTSFDAIFDTILYKTTLS